MPCLGSAVSRAWIAVRASGAQFFTVAHADADDHEVQPSADFGLVAAPNHATILHAVGLLRIGQIDDDFVVPVSGQQYGRCEPALRLAGIDRLDSNRDLLEGIGADAHAQLARGGIAGQTVPDYPPGDRELAFLRIAENDAASRIGHGLAVLLAFKR